MADYDEAIRLDPKFAIAYGNRGNVYDARRDYDRAVADYDRGDPARSQVRCGLHRPGLGLQQEGRAGPRPR